MDGIILLLTLIIALTGVSVGIWSILNTRKKKGGKSEAI